MVAFCETRIGNVDGRILKDLNRRQEIGFLKFGDRGFKEFKILVFFENFRVSRVVF